MLSIEGKLLDYESNPSSLKYIGWKNTVYTGECSLIFLLFALISVKRIGPLQWELAMFSKHRKVRKPPGLQTFFLKRKNANIDTHRININVLRWFHTAKKVFSHAALSRRPQAAFSRRSLTQRVRPKTKKHPVPHSFSQKRKTVRDGVLLSWRRRRDSNPWDVFDAYAISSRAPSTKLGDFSIKILAN